MKKLTFVLLCFCFMTFGSSARIIEVAPAGAWGVLGISGGNPPVAGGGISRLGYDQWCSSVTNTEITAITIHASTEMIVLGVGGYDVLNMFDAPSASPRICDASDCSGTNYDLTHIVSEDTGAAEMITLWYLKDPAVTGSRWLQTNWSSATPAAEGLQYYLVYYDGVDTTGDPIQSSCATEAGAAAAACDPGTAGAGDGMMAVSFHDAGTSSIAWTNATEIDEDACTGQGSIADDNTFESSVTVTSTGTGASYSAVAVVVFDGD